jgi:UDP-N-acetylmuramoyl-L-alanyl-D-glutamate--2,6-diaminopimelate ligase
MDADMSSIVQGIESIESIPGRLQRVECGQRFSVFVDGSPTPGDLQRTLQTLREVTRGKLICVVGEGDADNSDLRCQRGAVAERFSDLQIITSDDPTDPRPLQAAHDLLDGFREPAGPHLFPNRVRAIEWALAEAQPEDTVLIVGPHNRRLVRTEVDYLPDAEVARYWLFESSQDSTEWIFADK